MDGGDGVSSMEVSDIENGKLPHTPCSRSKRLMNLSKHIDGPDGVSSVEVSDLDNAKPSHTPCRRSKRLMEFSKHTEGHETRGVNPNQPLAKKPKFTPVFTCEICTETKPTMDIFRVKGCRHFYCSVCISKYIGSKIRNNILAVTCPQPTCSRPLEPQQSQSILPKAVYNRWCRALCETLILDTSQGYYCPFKKCSALVINDLRENCRRSECPHCRRSFCVDCKVAWHRSLTCKEFQKRKPLNKLIKLAKKKKWQNCPRCKFYIERVDGCNHMQCRCGCHFCYKCGKKSCDGDH
ncbi:RBR-type E3 ubiquitin transferase [Ranunculus cassubicifolius]